MTSRPPSTTPTTYSAAARGNESARGRRVRAASLALLGIVAAIVCLVLVNALAKRFSARLDVTATGDHRLSPRTELTLESLEEQYRIALAGELSAVDRGQLERVRDVLGQMQRTSPYINVRLLDTSSPTGQQDFASLISELAARDHEVLELQTASIRAAAERARSSADYLDSVLAPALASMRDSLPMDAQGVKLRETLDSRAGGCRLSASDLRSAAKASEEPLTAKMAGIVIPQTDVAAQTLRGVLASVGEQVSTLAREIKAIAGASQLPQSTRDIATTLVPAVEQSRDAALSTADLLSRLTRPDVLRVAGALSQGSACIVVGPPGSGLMAIEFNQLFPPALRGAESAADAGRRAEQLVSTAIGALASPVRPIVVIMHTESINGLAAPGGRFFSRLIERLSLRGIDVAEWPVVLQPEPPALTSINPDGKRPVVYVTFAPDSSAARARPMEPTGAERAQKLGDAIDVIAGKHHPILLSMNPSVLPAYGDADPTTAILTRLGLAADTARPLLRERLTPQGRIVETDQSLRGSGGEHAIQRAIRGLPTLIPWPISIKPAASTAAPSGAVFTPLLEAPPESESWGESQWLNYWRVPRAERAVSQSQPVFDEGRDSKESPQAVAYAVELPAAGGHPRQRLLAVGSNSWFIDPVTTPLINLDGRTFAANPGNLELFEAGIYWLAGQDELIAQSPEARAVAVIGTMTEGRLRTIRLLLVIGLPVLVLVIGGVYRLLRG